MHLKQKSHSILFFLNQALRNLNHEHIVKCKEAIRISNGTVYLVFELLTGGNLEALTRNRVVPLAEHEIRTMFYQLLLALQHMHSHRYLHRDLKPENILLRSNDMLDLHIKVADLGLTTYVNPDSQRPRTTYISTRWYRSPEILLQMSDYSFPSDMWAAGALMAELVCHGQPLLPGEDEKDQLARIVALRGHPEVIGWPRGAASMKSRRIKLPKTTPDTLNTVLRRASAPLVQLIRDLLELDPQKRPTAVEALSYPFFLPRLSESYELPVSRKRQRRYYGIREETAGTSEIPSGNWSEGDGENIEQADDAFVEVESPFEPLKLSGASKYQRAISTTRPAKRFRRVVSSSDSMMFNIAHVTEPTFSSWNVENPKQMFELRRPAENFNLRSCSSKEHD